jgi:Tol biopolymer transport system component
MRVLRTLPALLPALAVTVLALHTGTAGAGQPFLVSGLPGTAPPSPTDFAISGTDEASGPGDLSANGRFVAFASRSDGLVATAEDRRYQHVFVKDRQTGQLTNLTAGANGSSGSPTISDDGTTVAFETVATNLTPADTTRDTDVLVRRLDASGTTVVVTGTGNDGVTYPSLHPQLSGNGSRIAFVTPTPLVPGDLNGLEDVYVVAATGGAAELVSVTGGAAGNKASTDPAISDDGLIVAFGSRASNLVANDLGSHADVFVRDTAADVTVRASAVSGATQAGDADSYSPALSGDGAYVAFSSRATNLTAGDTDGNKDVFRRQVDRGQLTTGATVMSSVGPGSDVDQHDSPVISDSGFRVGYYSYGQGDSSLHVRDASAPAATPLGLGGGASLLGLNGSGSLRLVLDGRFTPAVEPGPTIVAAGSTAGEVVSRPSDGTPLVSRLTASDDSNTSRGWNHRLSRDGRFAVFSSASPGLPGADGRTARIYRRDGRTGDVELVSRATGPTGAAADDAYGEPSISADGTRVAFGSTDVLEPDAGGAARKAYVRDLTAGTTTLVSRPSGTAAYAPPADVDRIQISADGRRVLFVAAGLDATPVVHVYVRDPAAGTTELVDRADGPAGVPAATGARQASLSGDGRRVAFASAAKNLGDAATPNQTAVRVRDLDAGSTVLVSRASGPDGAVTADDATDPILSADGQTVAFEAHASDVDPSAAPWADGDSRVVVRDLRTFTTTLVSRGPGGGAVADAEARSASLSADGRRVAYTSAATNLGDGSGLTAVYVRTVATGEQVVIGVSGHPDPDGASRGAGVGVPSLSGDGRCVLFVARGIDVVPGVSPDFEETFARALTGSCGVVDDPASPGEEPGPGGPGPGGPGAPGTPGDATPAAPRISGLRVSRPRFRVGRGATATVRSVATVPAARRAKPRRTPAGTTVRFALSSRADVRFAVAQRTSGRRVGKTCRAATKRLARRRACVRWVAKGTLTRRDQAAGRRTLAFSGRVGRRALRPGRYRVVLVATGPGGRSRPATATFTVARR